MSIQTEQTRAGNLLAEAKSLLTPALRAAVDTLTEPIRPVAAYHFGWQDERGAPISADSGKALRPTLTLLSAQAVGADQRDALPAAVAVELVHNFSLLHDDIMDGDTHRRHRPTAWSVFGGSAAILAGDALLNLAIHTLAMNKHATIPAQLRILTAAVHDLLGGQGYDLEFERRETISCAEYLGMAQRKTGALLASASALGALAGGASVDQVEHLYSYGEHVGLAFQFVDDILGIWGDPAVTGKPVLGDLLRRKKSLPVVLALAEDSAAGRELCLLYRGDGPQSERQAARAAELIESTGARVECRRRCDAELAEALRQLDAAVPGEQGNALGSLAEFLSHRDR